jgi:hypothetical protein
MPSARQRPRVPTRRGSWPTTARTASSASAGAATSSSSAPASLRPPGSARRRGPRVRLVVALRRGDQAAPSRNVAGSATTVSGRLDKLRTAPARDEFRACRPASGSPSLTGRAAVDGRRTFAVVEGGRWDRLEGDGSGRDGARAFRGVGASRREAGCACHERAAAACDGYERSARRPWLSIDGRRGTGSDRPSADARSSSQAGVSGGRAETLACAQRGA